ncbi:MAG TPA: hypothetical protein VFU15_03085, partial [Bacteroidia bacterium]|nr:hypothetical protein [Bacteroidia bacterium]
TIHYGNAFNYCLSIGFLAYPYRYKSYKDVNINLYAEFYGKDYQAAKIYSDGQVIPVSGAPTLDGGNYVEARPAIQFIFKSNFRVDLCYGMKMIGRSYVNTYPLYMFNIQYYFFPKIKKYAYDQA